MAKREVYAGSGSNVAKEATEEMKRGGKAGGKKYARGGGVGSDKSPFSSAGGGGASKKPFSSAK